MSRPAVLIAALSGRALACSAGRAGYAPLVADLFCDLDTQEAAQRCAQAGSLARGLRPKRLLDTLRRLGAGSSPIGVVTGCGFEDRPGLLDRIAARHVLLGNTAATVARTKDPLGFAALCRAHGVPHPAISLTAASGWLVKRTGGSGGLHIRHARPGRPLRPGRYAQRRTEGRPVSALFLGDGGAGMVLGFSAQWPDPLPRRPFRYGGAVRPARLREDQREAMSAAVLRLIAPLGLRGLNSVDFLLREDGFDLLEINPRPGATLDIHPDAEGQLFTQHIAACQGRLPRQIAEETGAAAASIVYAPRLVRVPPGFAWPAWTADRQAPESPVPPGAPLCTVRAEAADADAARALLRERAQAILASVPAA